MKLLKKYSLLPAGHVTQCLVMGGIKDLHSSKEKLISQHILSPKARLTQLSETKSEVVPHCNLFHNLTQKGKMQH